VIRNRATLAALCLSSAVGIIVMTPWPATDGAKRLGERAEFEPDYQQALKSWEMVRAYPYDRIDTKMYEEAYKMLKRQKAGNRYGSVGVWEYIGPKNNHGAEGIYNGDGPVSGRVNAIAFASSAADSPMYIAAPTGGVHESRDGGVTWTPLTDLEESLCASSIAFKPGNPNLMLVGTGDYHGSRQVGAIGILKGTYSGGSWSFVNKGRAEMLGTAVSKVIFDPETPTVALAACGRGSNGVGKVWRSTNSGDTWTEAIATQRPWNTVKYGAMSPATGRRLYYAVGDGAGDVLMRSSDKGKTWKPIPRPLEMIGDQEGVDIAPSPVEPEVVYLMSGKNKCIWKSENGGNKWARLVEPLVAHGFPFGENAYNWTQKSYDWFIECGSHLDNMNKPVDDVYVGLITLAHSGDGGQTWTDIGKTYDNAAETHNDHHCLAFKPGNGYETMWVGNDGGIYKVTYDPTGPTFAWDRSLNKDLYITQFYKCDWDNKTPQPDTILGGTQDNGTPWSNASPPIWRKNLNFGDGSGSAIGDSIANAHKYQFAGGYGSNWDLSQAGDNVFTFLATKDWWNPVPDYDPCNFGAHRSAFFPPVAVDSSNPRYAYTASDRLFQYDLQRPSANTTVTAGANSDTQTVASTADMFVGQQLTFFNDEAAYAVTVESITNATTVVLDFIIDTTDAAHGVWKVTGGKWVETTGKKTLSTTWVTAIGVAKSDNAWILTGSLGGEVWRSNNAGSTAGGWSNVSANLPARPVSDIAIHPTDKNKVWITMQGAPNNARVCYTDLSVLPVTWTLRGQAHGLPPVPANCLCFDPDNPKGKIFVGTDSGVYFSRDGGASFESLTGNSTWAIGLPNVPVTGIKVVGTGATRTLNVSTFGRGIWRLSINFLP
jgi:hypothetical protein